jgi:hypothetical protein
MPNKRSGAGMTVCVLPAGEFQCEDCGHELYAGDRYIYDQRTGAHTCSVGCAEGMRARGHLRPRFATTFAA